MKKIDEIVDMGDRLNKFGKAMAIEHEVINNKKEWDDETITDFLSDFFNIDVNNLNTSTHKLFTDQYDVLISHGVGRVNAELMAAGIEWYLDNMVRNLGLEN